MERATRQNPLATAKDLGEFTIVDAGGGNAQIQLNGVNIGPPFPLSVIPPSSVGTADALPYESAFWWQTEPAAVNGRVFVGTSGVDNGVWLQEWTQPVTNGPMNLQRYFLGYARLGFPATGLPGSQERDDHVSAGLAIKAGKPVVAFWSAHNTDNQLCYRISDQNVDDALPGGLTFGPTKSISIPDPKKTSYAQVMNDGTDIWVAHRIGVDPNDWTLTKIPAWGTGTPVQYGVVFTSADQAYMKARMVSGKIRCMVSDHPTNGTDNKIWYAEIDTSTGSITKADGTVLGNLDGTNLPLAEASLDTVFTSSGSSKPWGFDVGYNATRELVFVDGSPSNFSATAKYKYARWTGSAWTVTDIADVGMFVSGSTGSYFPSITFVPDAANQILLVRGTKTLPTGTHYVEKYSTSNSGATWALNETIESASVVNNADNVAPRRALVRAYPVRIEVGTTPFAVIAHDVRAYPNYYYDWKMFVRPMPLSLEIKRVPGPDTELVRSGVRSDLLVASRPQTGVYLPGTSGTYIEGPNVALPTNGLRLEVDLSLRDWNIASVLTLFAKESTASKREARIILNPPGVGQTGCKIGFYWSEDGSTAKSIIPNNVLYPAPGQRVQLAIEFTPTTIVTPSGAAGPQYVFMSFYRYGDDQPWIMLDQTQATPATSFFVSDSPWEIGGRRLGTTELTEGVFFRAAVKKRGGSTTLAEWRADRGGTTQKDLQGNTWVTKPALVVDTAAANVIDVPNDLDSGQATFNRRLMNGAATLGTGNLRLTYFTARKSETVNNVRTIVGTLATSVTLSRIGIYTVDGSGNLTLVASTPNDTSLWSSTGGSITQALSVGYAVTRGQRYAIGLLIVNTGTACTISGNVSIGSSTEAAQEPRLSGFVASQTDLPSSVVAASVSNSANGYYAVLVP